MARKMICVIEFDVSEEDPDKLQNVMQMAKPIFETEPGLRLYGAIDETAEAIVGFLKDGLPEPSEP